MESNNNEPNTFEYHDNLDGLELDYVDDRQIKCDLFEDVVQKELQKPPSASPVGFQMTRGCSSMHNSQNEIDSVTEGEYCALYVSGGGIYTQWYYYLSKNGTHAYIYENNGTNTYLCDILNDRPKPQSINSLSSITINNVLED